MSGRWVGWLAGLLLLLLWLGSDWRPDGGALVVSPASGRYERGQWVRLQTAVPGATVRYTLNGRLPGEPGGLPYRGPIFLTAREPGVTVVRAQAFAGDGTAVSEVVTAHYALGWGARLPLLSLAIDPADFGGPNGIYTHFEAKGRAWERPVALAYLGQERPFVATAGLRIHGNWTRTFFAKKSLRLYFREAYGAAGWPLWGDMAADRFVLHNSGQDLLLLKNSLMAELAAEVGVPAARSQPLLLFINGEPWGIYHLRERIDAGFLRRRFGEGGYDLLDTPDNVGQEQVVAGSRAHWDGLLAYLESHDVAQPETVAYLETQVDFENLMDYAILQMYAADRDWPEFNVNQFRPQTANGRWHWLFWDNDLSFEEAERPVLGPVLAPADEATGRLLRVLLGNVSFRARFLARADELLDTVLAAEVMVGRVERLTAVYDADIELERQRWELEHTWEGRRQDLLEFVQQRPAVMRRELHEGLGGS